MMTKEYAEYRLEKLIAWTKEHDESHFLYDHVQRSINRLVNWLSWQR